MRKFLIPTLLLTSTILPISPAPADEGARIIVSHTLNHTLQVFDSLSLEEIQSLPSKGTSPIRLWVQEFDGNPYLFSANHGIGGSLGIFDLSGEEILESAGSPVPTGGLGSVGVAAGTVSVNGRQRHVVAATNTHFALGGCDLPNGSVSLFDATDIATTGTIIPAANSEVSGAIPYAVAVDEANGALWTSTNCGDSIDSMSILSPLAKDVDEQCPGAPSNPCGQVEPVLKERGPLELGDAVTTSLPSGPDATLFDAARNRSYTVNIGGNSLSVVDASTHQQTLKVPLNGAGPIDASFGTSDTHGDLIFTSNGRDDTFSIVSLTKIAACEAASQSLCGAAELARIDAGVDGGAPEGIAYDQDSNRVFVVNKSPLGAPSLSVIELSETASGFTGTFVAAIPLAAVTSDLPVPPIITFDVVVAPR